MKYILLAILITLLFLNADLKSQTALITGKNGSENKLNQNYTDTFKNTTLIEFNVKDDSFVKLYITDLDDSSIETLVDGEVDKGKHSVYFKAGEDVRSSKFKCKLEIYSEDKSSMIFSEESIINMDVTESSSIK